MQPASLSIHPEGNGGGHKIKVSINLPAGMNYVAIHIFHFVEARQDRVWSTSISAEEIGKIFNEPINNLVDGEIYGAYIGFTEDRVINLIHRPNMLPFVVYFKVENDAVHYLPETTIHQIFSNQLVVQETPWIVGDVDPSLGTTFNVVIFFTGVDIHMPSEMKGVRFHPIPSGVSNKATFEAVREFIFLHHDTQLPEEIGIIEGLLIQPLYAVELCKVLANSEEEALKYSSKLSYDISTLIAVDRGDRPLPLLTFIRNEVTGSWRTIPKGHDFRGSFLPPMSEMSIIVEEHLHIVRTQPRSRLVLELYVQSVAERDRSFQLFRQWSLLETIADNNVSANSDPLFNSDGTQIKLNSGTALNTNRKEGRVYAYLRNSGLSSITQWMLDGTACQIEGAKISLMPADERITLWEAVAASYKIRNAVAHEGVFNIRHDSTDKIQKLANRFFMGEFGFLHHAVKCALWQEFHRTPALEN
ncbi:hypothetical protein [Janthinobacterium sp. BJB301]|uniref:hypothetical protein n=1 Tax=Janthinobacterium sp. BJB301 TaxID=1560195 RepID=UPI00117A3EF6|nr:hypothetical protein [Janthinobacterium sp. BJB301]